MTLMLEAKSGKLTDLIKIVADQESIEVSTLCSEIAKGRIIIPKNKNHQLTAVRGVGRGLRTKINANIGTSPDHEDIKAEVMKAKAAVEAGADAVMDLSTSGDLRKIRRQIIKEVDTVIGTVPIYQAAVETIQKYKAITAMKPDDLFRVMEEQAEDGVDFFTVHCGVTLASLERLRKQGRTTNIVSRGGSFLSTWMIANGRENPFYEQYDKLVELAAAYDITLSLGDGLRPGCLADATDRAQIEELITLGELTEIAWEKGVQVMIEGPGHVPIQDIAMNMQIQKRLCKEAPFYVLGPIVTDVAPGYDHITSAIGGAIAASSGADFLCYVTPSEHLKLPDIDDVREGVIASRIAAHAGDIAKGVPHAMAWDVEMSRARRALDWEKQIALSINPKRARQLREAGQPCEEEICSMCGEYCAIKLVNETMGFK